MGVTSFQQSLYEFFDSGLLFRIALLQKTILFLLFGLRGNGNWAKPSLGRGAFGAG